MTYHDSEIVYRLVVGCICPLIHDVIGSRGSGGEPGDQAAMPTGVHLAEREPARVLCDHLEEPNVSLTAPDTRT